MCTSAEIYIEKKVTSMGEPPLNGREHVDNIVLNPRDSTVQPIQSCLRQQRCHPWDSPRISPRGLTNVAARSVCPLSSKEKAKF